MLMFFCYIKNLIVKTDEKKQPNEHYIPKL